MKPASPWEIYLPPAEHRRREVIRTVLQDQIDELFHWADALHHTDDEIRRLVRQQVAAAIAKIPDRDGMIHPLPQNPQLNLVHDPYGFDADYLLNRQQDYEIAVIERQERERRIDAQTCSRRVGEVLRKYDAIRERQVQTRSALASQPFRLQPAPLSHPVK